MLLYITPPPPPDMTEISKFITYRNQILMLLYITQPPPDMTEI